MPELTVRILGVEFHTDLPGGFALDARGFVSLCQVHEDDVVVVRL
jgi:hypothetical protein